MHRETKTLTRTWRSATRAMLTLALFAPVLADASMYWSVGSFHDLENAAREANRVAVATGLRVELGHSGALYRVVVEKNGDGATQNSQLEDAGLTPWTVDGADLEVMPVPEGMGVSQEAGGADDAYLVLASFTDPSSAQAFLDRMREDGVVSLALMEADVHGRTYHRVVQGPFETRHGVDDDYTRYGIAGAWWLAVARPQAPEPESRTARGTQLIDDMLASMPMRGTEAMNDEAPVPATVPMMQSAAPEEEPVYTLSPPRPNESYVDYCVRRANAMERAIYCKDSTFLQLSSAGLPENATDRERVIYCALYATGDVRRTRCRD